MKNIEIRDLDSGHADECLGIALSNKKISGIRAMSREHYESVLVESPNMNHLGYFEDDKLISWVSIGFYESKMRGKFWVITGLFTTVFGERFSFSRPEIGLLFKRAFEIAEGKGYFQYFYCIAERLERVYERQWKKNPWGFNGRYDLITLDIVPANTQPEYELYWRLMGKEVKPDNVAIKARKLKGYDPYAK
jgi:hypothetical protein